MNYSNDKYTNVPFQETRWATRQEIENATTRIDLTSYPYKTAGIPLLNDGKTAWVDSLDNHSLIFGSTGSKKSRLFVMPMLNIMANAGESFVVTDPKGELYERTSGMCREKGYQVITLNFRDFSKSDCWNPLSLAYQKYRAGDTNGASSILNDFTSTLSAPQRERTSDVFWPTSAESLMLGCALLLMEACPEEEVNMSSLVNLCLDYGLGMDKSTLPKLADFMHPLSVARQNLKGVVGAAEKTAQSIFVVLFSMIKIFTLQKDLVRMLSCNSFEMKSIGHKKTAVYLIIPDEKETFHFLVSVFIKQCYQTLIDDASNCPNGQLPVRVNFVLDEFANIPKIDAMGPMISAARSRNIRFDLVIQSMHQLTKRYGEDAETIKGNCTNWIYLNTKELSLLNELSELCGNVSSPYGGRRPLISVSQLQRLDKNKGECLIFCQRQYPFISEMADIDDCVWEHGASPEWPSTASGSYKVVDPVVLLHNLDQICDRNNPDTLLFAKESKL